MGMRNCAHWNGSENVGSGELGHTRIPDRRAVLVGWSGSGYVSGGEPRNSQLDSAQRTSFWKRVHDGGQRIGCSGFGAAGFMAHAAFWMASGFLYHIGLRLWNRGSLVWNGNGFPPAAQASVRHRTEFDREFLE